MSTAVLFDTPNAAPRFNKHAWENTFFRLRDAGALSKNVLHLVIALRRNCGTAEPSEHSPVNWRANNALEDDMKVAGKTFRSYRDALVEAGMLMEIASGQGHKQTIKILKMPAWSELEALRVALQNFDAYAERKGTGKRGWVRDALEYAIECAETAERATEPDPPPLEATEEQPGNSPAATGKNSRLPPYSDMERPTYGVETTSKHDASPARETATAPPDTQKTSSKAGEGRDLVDFEHIKTLREAFIRLFAELGRRLDEGVALKLARVYRFVDDPSALDAGTFGVPGGGRERLDCRLIRLFGDGRSVGAVAKYLVEDADDYRLTTRQTPPEPPTSVHDEQADRVADAPDTVDDVEPDASPGPEEPPEHEVPTVWRGILEELEGMVSAHNFGSWFAPAVLRCLAVDDERVVLEVGDEFKQAWIADQHADLLTRAACEVLGEPPVIELRAVSLASADELEPICWTDPAEVMRR
jgi:hypothetical protein